MADTDTTKQYVNKIKTDENNTYDIYDSRWDTIAQINSSSSDTTDVLAGVNKVATDNGAAILTLNSENMASFYRQMELLLHEAKNSGLEIAPTANILTETNGTLFGEIGYNETVKDNETYKYVFLGAKAVNEDSTTRKGLWIDSDGDITFDCNKYICKNLFDSIDTINGSTVKESTLADDHKTLDVEFEDRYLQYKDGVLTLIDPNLKTGDDSSEIGFMSFTDSNGQKTISLLNGAIIDKLSIGSATISGIDLSNVVDSQTASVEAKIKNEETWTPQLYGKLNPNNIDWTQTLTDKQIFFDDIIKNAEKNNIVDVVKNNLNLSTTYAQKITKTKYFYNSSSTSTKYYSLTDSNYILKGSNNGSYIKCITTKSGSDTIATSLRFHFFMNSALSNGKWTTVATFKSTQIPIPSETCTGSLLQDGANQSRQQFKWVPDETNGKSYLQFFDPKASSGRLEAGTEVYGYINILE